MNRYFAMDGEEVKFFLNAEAAKATAEKAVEKWTRYAQADREWPEEIYHVCWGKIEQGVMEQLREDDMVDCVLKEIP